MTTFIAYETHFSEVLSLVPKVKRSLWIGTANIKNLSVLTPVSAMRVSGD